MEKCSFVYLSLLVCMHIRTNIYPGSIEGNLFSKVYVLTYNIPDALYSLLAFKQCNCMFKFYEFGSGRENKVADSCQTSKNDLHILEKVPLAEGTRTYVIQQS